MEIVAVDNNQKLINIVAELADEIWREHYAGIVPAAQIDYMLENFQSAKAVLKQISEKNYKYYLMRADDGKFCGYFAFVIEEDKVFLSKIYVQKDSRKKGYAKKAFAFLKDSAISLKLSSIYLTVNRENARSIEAYKKMNFFIDGEVNQDIGCGFFMNDYKMSLKLG
jgi:ribosomal protein S18 acetylase RimI-like enzyme